MPKKTTNTQKSLKEKTPSKKNKIKLTSYKGQQKKPVEEDIDDDISDCFVEYQEDKGTQAASKKEKASKTTGKISKVAEKLAKLDVISEDEKNERLPKKKVEKKRDSGTQKKTSSTQSKSQKQKETDMEEEEPPKAKGNKKGKGGKKAKKDSDNSEEEFKVDEDLYNFDDIEEEDDLKKKLNKKGNDSDSIPEDDDDYDGKPKLKKVKKSGGSGDKKGSNKGSGSKEPKGKKSEKSQKKSSKESPAGIEDEGALDLENGPINDFLPILEDGNFDESSYYIPDWISEENIRDKNGRRPGERGYDPTSVLVPNDAFGKSNFLQQYWEFKKDHYDKLVGIKLWKFYFFFYNDAFVLSKLLDLKVNGWNQWTYVNFYETTLNKHGPKILDAGHKIVLVEQMEESRKNNNDLVKREICQIITRGTAVDNYENDYSSRFSLTIFEDNLNFGVVLCDTTTHEFHIGEFKDDVNRSNLRTILIRTKPVEVIFMKSFLEEDSLNMIKSLSIRPTVSNVTRNEVRHFRDVLENLGEYFKTSESLEPKFPQIITEMSTSFENEFQNVNQLSQSSQPNESERKMPFFLTIQALGICVEYLQSMLLAETVVSMGTFTPFDLTIEKKSTLYLDSQALINLEVLDVQYLNSSSESSSLFGYMDKTVTQFGKRMLKRWITSPLIDHEAIKERQNAVNDLIKNMDVMEYFRDRLAKLPDIERMVNKIYNLSSKQRMSAIYLEDFAKNRLKDFLAFLKELKKIEDLVDTFHDYVQNFNSNRLVELTTFKDVDIQAFKERKKSVSKKIKGKPTGIFPRINHILADLEGMIVISDGNPVPAPGVSPENDELVEKIKEVKSLLQDYLERQRRKFDCDDIKYAHTRLRYQLEIPEHLVEGSKRPKDFTITSKRKGYQRFHTPEIESCLRKLLHYEYDFQKVFVPFVCDYFKRFYERNNYWHQVISCLSELDCLCSLAQLATTMDIKFRPEVLPKGDERIFELRDMVHPMAAKSNLNFVPNDVVVEEPVDTFLITGPNMGGKSTLLRQVCLATIMAQVGSYVPARYFRLNAIDRIFTRIGASDRILEGKSTFFIEMEETHSIVTEATRNSLLILDELGRGTSTYDGVSIAYGTLKYVAEKVGCITLFATHYHLLLEEFRLYKNIETYHMECEFNQRKDEVKFLYKFAKGQSMKSHGVVIAKMAGLPDNVIGVAKKKAEFMTKEKRNIGFEKNLLEKFNRTIGELSIIEDNKNFNPDTILHELHQMH